MQKQNPEILGEDWSSSETVSTDLWRQRDPLWGYHGPLGAQSSSVSFHHKHSDFDKLK